MFWRGRGYSGWRGILVALVGGALAGTTVRLAAGPTGTEAAAVPHWLWKPAAAEGSAGAEDVACFRKRFMAPPMMWRAVLTVAADDAAEVFLNGRNVASVTRAARAVRLEVTVRMNQGSNVIALRAVNRSGPAGVLVRLEMTGTRGDGLLVSDGTWKAASRDAPGWNRLAFDDAAWAPAKPIAKLGDPPWGDVMHRAVATPVSAIRVAPGFRVERLRSAAPEEGSWICLTVDPQGRLIISPERDEHRLLRLTLDEDGQVSGLEPIAPTMGHAMGLLWAFGSLYVNGHGPEGTGLYRLIDADRDDRFAPDEVHLLKRFRGEGEHGYHALAAGPDGMLYVLNGNGTRLPEGLAPESPLRHYSGDMLPYRPRGREAEAPKLGAPGGHILRTDPEGRRWELLCGGFRNPYDFALDPEGEIFTFDSDMEWDWGAPWYRPNRVFHCVPGGDYGWREGTHKLFPDYPDVWPPVVTVGIGSPTGMAFGTGSAFPKRYRRALFVQDWSYGRLLAVHLAPAGATYRGRVEEVLVGNPLNLTDMAFGRDGALYFITGGRGTQSGLYRLSWVGGHAADGPEEKTRSGARGVAEETSRRARAERRRLEALARGRETAPSVVATVWPKLGSPDRWVRQAARLALESQPVAAWEARAFSERDPGARLTAWLALARVGGPERQPRLHRALLGCAWERLTDEQRLAWLRVWEVSLCRHGLPEEPLGARLRRQLLAVYPAASWSLNRELMRLLVHLREPGVVSRTMALLPELPTQEQQIACIAALRGMEAGWTPGDREAWFRWFLQDRRQLGHPPELVRWFRDVGREYTDGAQLDQILHGFRAAALAKLPQAERDRLTPLLAARDPDPDFVPSMDRQFVRHWEFADLLPDLERVQRGRNFERGRRAFIDAQCLACHRLGDHGSAVGPELGGVGKKYSIRDLWETLVEPSKVISEQYQATTFELEDDEEISGLITAEDDDEVTVLVNPLTNYKVTLPTSEIRRRRVSKVSVMPVGLIDILEREELLDLLAYLTAAGDPNAACFAPAP